MARVQTCPHLATFTGTLRHYMDRTSTGLKAPLRSGPICSNCPFLTVPFMTVPARIIFPSGTYLSEMEN